MKVLQVLPELNSGGVERGTVEFAKFLIAEGNQSLVLSNGGRLVSQLEQEGSRHLTLPVHKKSLLSLRLIPQLVRLLKEEQPDILHLRSRAPAWLCYLAWKKLPPANRPRLITTVHGFYSVNFYSAVMTKGEQVICVSNSVKDYVLKNYPQTAPEKLTVIHRGVDSSLYRPEYRPATEWQEAWHQQFPHLKDKTLITLPGRITRWKGQDDFLEIIHLLREEHPNIHGLIAGGPHARKQAFWEELQARAKELKLESHLTFLGHRDDLLEVLATSDLVLSLSHDPEAFGRVSLEALSLGKPVVAYDHGGVAEQMKALFPEGAVMPDGFPEAVAKISAFLNNPPKPPNKFLPEFTLPRMNQAILQVYEDLFSDKTRA